MWKNSWRILQFALLGFLALAAVAGTLAPEIPVKEIHSPFYFALYVEDVDLSVEWYGSTLGLEPLGGSAAEDGSWRIENLGNERLRVEIIRDQRAQGVDRALGFRKVGFYVPDVEQVAERIEKENRPRIVDFEALGQRIIQLKDPEGNVVQLQSPMKPSS